MRIERMTEQRIERLFERLFERVIEQVTERLTERLTEKWPALQWMLAATNGQLHWKALLQDPWPLRCRAQPEKSMGLVRISLKWACSSEN